jgi:SOS-response transcriptional repressor LexA
MKDDEPTTNGMSIHAGFPNPASDGLLGELDLDRLLIHRPASTYIFRLRGHEWEDLGIFDGDIAIVDRALDARPDDLVIWWHETRDSFAISKFNRIDTGATVWGVVTAVIHQFSGVDR